jgi:uncharacterized protein (TIGR00369 family)
LPHWVAKTRCEGQMSEAVPGGFRLLKLPRNGFIDLCGPMYGRYADQKFVLGFRVEARHCNPAKMCHGGMLLTLADMSMLIGSNLQTGMNRYLLTVNLSSDFLAPAPLDSWIEGRVEVLKVTPNLLFAQGTLSIEQAPIARINGIFKPVGEPAPNVGPDAFFAD